LTLVEDAEAVADEEGALNVEVRVADTHLSDGHANTGNNTRQTKATKNRQVR
jgi:hypothetical protein